MGWLRELSNDFNDHVIMVEDDDRTAYAYYVVDLENPRGGFVWLYNVEAAPDEMIPPEDGRGPLNAKPFVKPVSFERPTEEDLVVYWVETEGEYEAGIYIRGKLHAVLAKDSRPGWCVLAADDGPVAGVLQASDAGS